MSRSKIFHDQDNQDDERQKHQTNFDKEFLCGFSFKSVCISSLLTFFVSLAALILFQQSQCENGCIVSGLIMVISIGFPCMAGVGLNDYIDERLDL